MTWYEWSIKVAAINNEILRRREDHELVVEMFRTSLMYLNNWKGGKAEKTDFWRLSYDSVPTTEADNQQVQETIKRLERIAKKKKRG